jgi:tRNA(Ile)-lysidine synthase
MRLLRGASTHGLGGIPPVRGGTIVRPLISMRRAAIERFLHENGCDFIPDTSAQETQYLRNRVRHELLPLLARRYNPRIVEALCTAACLARDDEAFLRAATESALDGSLPDESAGARISVGLLERNPLLAGRIVRRAIETVQGSSRGLTSVHIDAVASLTGCTGSGKRIPLPGGLVALREYEDIVIGFPDSPPTPFQVQVDRLPADMELPMAGVRVQIRRRPIEAAAPLERHAGDTLLLSAAGITLPLIVRSWRPGDRIRLPGSGLSKKVKDVFADRKIPVRLRSRVPLLVSGDSIICVGTLCMAERFRVTPDCRETIAVTVVWTSRG